VINVSNEFDFLSKVFQRHYEAPL